MAVGRYDGWSSWWFVLWLLAWWGLIVVEVGNCKGGLLQWLVVEVVGYRSGCLLWWLPTGWSWWWLVVLVVDHLVVGRGGG